MNDKPVMDCSKIEAELDPGRTVTLVPVPNESYLSTSEHTDYEWHRSRFLRWLFTRGKEPDHARGYSAYTVYVDSYRDAKFDRWVWDREDGYTFPPTRTHADEYMEEIAYGDNSQATKSKKEEMLHRYYRWLHETQDIPEWEPDITFTRKDTAPQDYLTRDERHDIRQAALTHGSIPSYHTVSEEEIQTWKEYVADELDLRKAEVGPDEFERVDSWKLTSLVWTSLDAGLRPVEVASATVDWVDIDNAMLRIPADESRKNRDNWRVSLQRRTAQALESWLKERAYYPAYDDSDRLWLTSHGNPYGSKSLGRLLRRLCKDVGIEIGNQSMSWYTNRHSVGTYMTREEDLKAAKDQLRHSSVQTTMKYDQTPTEDRRDALDRMG